MRRYSKALRLVEKISDGAALSDSAAEKGGLRITRVDSALLLMSEKPYALPVIGAAAADTRDSMK